MKIDFSMLIFNGDYVLQQNLQSIYPYANKIVITEGPVSYYQSLGYTTSTDRTIDIIKNFPDPKNKIVLIQGQWKEKDEMWKAQEQYFSGDYVWIVDSDELYQQETMDKVVEHLTHSPEVCSIAFRLYSFYGGLDRYITGFEEDFEVVRIQKRGRIITHRPPTMSINGVKCKDINHINQFESEKLFGRIFHYPYVFASQVFAKIRYYQSWTDIIPDYINEVYIPWMRAKTEKEKLDIEQRTLGVQEFPAYRRGPAFTKAFEGTHPDAIEAIRKELEERVATEIK